MVRECNWGVTLDLKKGYYQVLMGPEARQCFGVEFGGRTMANVLPFGLSIAPHVFQTLTAFVGRLVRQLTGVQVVGYLDDFLLGASSKEKLEQAVGKTRELFMKLGMVISPKCNLIPSQVLTFLGLEWDLSTKEVIVGEEKKEAYRENKENLLKKKEHALLTIQKIVGKLNFLTNAVPVGMLRWVRGVGRSKTRSAVLSERAKEDLNWWLQALRGTLKSSITRGKISATLTTDASNEGLGYRIVVGDKVIERSLPLVESRAHINIRELQAVFEAIQTHRELPSNGG